MAQTESKVADFAEKMRVEYEMALYSQSACNSSGLIFRLAKAMELICEEERTKGTYDRNHHPIVILYLEQLCHLSGTTLMHPKYAEAHAACEKGAAKDGLHE